MVCRYRLITLFTFLVGSVALAGCSKEPAESSAPAANTTATTESADAPASSGIVKAFAELSDEDRQVAVAQKICPVSGKALDAGSTPIKLAVDNRDVFICCEGCRETILADPATYLAKIDAQ